jgi:hypothetical protein
MSAFDHFTNPFKEPASVPENLRHHPSLRRYSRLMVLYCCGEAYTDLTGLSNLSGL